jgi:uncharacterized repeat protein (TIGR03803 family)
MNTRNLSRTLAVLARAGGCVAVFLLTGWLATSAHAGVVFTSLYSFTGTNDGAGPNGLVRGSDGYFYGTTVRGGTNGFDDGDGDPFVSYGAIFKISTNGVLTSLYSFGSIQDQYGDPLDGEQPEAGLVQGSDGNFYGTTSGGGYDDGSALGEGKGDGTVFKITTKGVLTSLYLFTDGDNLGDVNDGFEPQCALLQGSDGNFYGTTLDSVFELGTNGVLTGLLPNGFNGYDGLDAQASLVQGNDGNFYGTTLEGGIGYSPYSPNNTAAGTVFKISTNGVLTSLQSFSYTNVDNGLYPSAGLLQGSDGNFYGTTSGHGPGSQVRSRGTVFKMSPNGILTSLHSFAGQEGSYPSAGLVQGTDGSLYGTTEEGGTNDSGTVFKINPDGTGFTTLFTFSARTQISEDSGVVTNTYGAFPQASLIFVGNTLYGTTSGGGIYGYGTVFSLTLPVLPQLNIIYDGVNAVLTWPADATGFNDAGYTLESAASLVSPIGWQTNSVAPIVIGGQNVITNPISGAEMFFRLTQ